ncbi:MAG: tRNA (adenosine(37)-N6)-threonylcarbamoyltransferase complex ATPase subunit type 1 TsaE [bacterium]
MQKLESDSPQKTEIIAKEFAKQLKPLDFISVNGPLGAGKTKFSSGIIRFFCSGKNEKIFTASPSYSLMNSYDCGITLNHFDFYRLKKVYDLENCGFFDSLEGENITIAEWTDMVKIDYKKYVSGSYYAVNIKNKLGEKKEKRNIEIEKIF